jgi:hypothetical protein
LLRSSIDGRASKTKRALEGIHPSIVLRIAKALITGARNGEQAEHLRELGQLAT